MILFTMDDDFCLRAYHLEWEICFFFLQLDENLEGKCGQEVFW